MECPKCSSIIDDNSTVCPYCHKVIALKCPNCHTLGESPVCKKCGYTILVKCAKCSKISPIENGTCSKCGFSLETSLAYQECESDDFASITIRFGALRKIRSLLKSQELYSKFLFRLKNLLYAQLKGVDCKFITYGDEFVINMNKELSLTTSSHKAIRLALKIINAFSELNNNIAEELSTPLNLVLTVTRKKSEDLQKLMNYENNVKLLTVKKGAKKYLKGFQLVLDQYVWEEINKDYKTDSLYTVEEAGQQLMFYEVILDSYVLPPNQKENSTEISAIQQNIKKDNLYEEKDSYSFKVFDINAKCSFERVNPVVAIEKLDAIDFEKGGKIVSMKQVKNSQMPINDLIKHFEAREIKVLRVNCSQQLTYKPWGFFIELFKENFGFPFYNKFINLSSINPNSIKVFKPLFDILYGKSVKALTPEDARFTYMEYWGKFLSTLSNTVILVDGFENLDDTSLQTLELYFDKFKNVKPNFVFINDDIQTVHSKIKGLLRTGDYTEFTLTKTPMDSCLTTLKSDATDFIQSFYFEKIKSNFKGSYLYFINAIEYLKEAGVLIDFENKLIIKDKKSIVIPSDYNGLLKARLKNLSKSQDVSLIIAYLAILGGRVDMATLAQLGVNDVEKHSNKLVETGLVDLKESVLSLNNFSEIYNVIISSLKKDAESYLAKTVLTQLAKGLDDTTMALMMGRLLAYKEEYLTLWKNSQFAIKTGDYDAYLKNCLGFLSLVENIETNIAKEEVEANKKDVYNNILMFLYSYSPTKIYFIENILLMDAINDGDDERIVKLSNLMLQGALVSSNYTDALGLLHNILTRMPQQTLIVDGALNTKFFLLSLVNVEILYNIGEYRQCVEIIEEILKVLRPEVLEKVKPASFSMNLFVNHVLDTCRLAGFAKLYLMDDDLEHFFENVRISLDVDLPEKDAILAIKDYLADKVYMTGDIENCTAFSKILYLILQELSTLEADYKKFAQNIYQAKLLALDIHQKELGLFCDLLIGYAYSLTGVNEKAQIIYDDVLQISDKSAMFNILAISKYLKAKLLIKMSKKDDALVLVNDSLSMIRKYDNQAKILYVLFEKLYIDIVKSGTVVPCDIETEENKLAPFVESLKKITG